MRINSIKVFALALITAFAASCSNSEKERKIAELESQFNGDKKTESPATLKKASETTAAAEKPEGPLPVVEFAELEYDFGTINEGQVVEHTFEVKNTGEAPLVISKAAPSCGCTVPDWTKEAIPVGGKGFVKAKFDSNGKPGMQNKTITVTTNAWPKQNVLRFKAMVVAKAQQGADGPVRK